MFFKKLILAFLCLMSPFLTVHSFDLNEDLAKQFFENFKCGDNQHWDSVSENFSSGQKAFLDRLVSAAKGIKITEKTKCHNLILELGSKIGALETFTNNRVRGAKILALKKMERELEDLERKIQYYISLMPKDGQPNSALENSVSRLKLQYEETKTKVANNKIDLGFKGESDRADQFYDMVLDTTMLIDLQTQLIDNNCFDPIEKLDGGGAQTLISSFSGTLGLLFQNPTGEIITYAGKALGAAVSLIAKIIKSKKEKKEELNFAGSEAPRYLINGLICSTKKMAEVHSSYLNTYHSYELINQLLKASNNDLALSYAKREDSSLKLNTEFQKNYLMVISSLKKMKDITLEISNAISALKNIKNAKALMDNRILDISFFDADIRNNFVGYYTLKISNAKNYFKEIDPSLLKFEDAQGVATESYARKLVLDLKEKLMDYSILSNDVLSFVEKIDVELSKFSSIPQENTTKIMLRNISYFTKEILKSKVVFVAKKIARLKSEIKDICDDKNGAVDVGSVKNIFKDALIELKDDCSGDLNDMNKIDSDFMSNHYQWILLSNSIVKESTFVPEIDQLINYGESSVKFLMLENAPLVVGATITSSAEYDVKALVEYFTHKDKFASSTLGISNALSSSRDNYYESLMQVSTYFEKFIITYLDDKLKSNELSFRGANAHIAGSWCLSTMSLPSISNDIINFCSRPDIDLPIKDLSLSASSARPSFTDYVCIKETVHFKRIKLKNRQIIKTASCEIRPFEERVNLSLVL